ncbi:MAG: histidinol-phosphatase [Clostridia bacterium]|nr:histidinol-phosphatase [Clostridia bacterium]
MILSSPHVHTTFCDGKSTAEEQVFSAIAHGCGSLGFSGHAPQRFDPPCCMSADAEKAYVAEIRRLHKAYAERIRIWLGLELDLFSCAGTAGYDYVIGSVHYLPAPDGFVAADGDPIALKALADTVYRGDGLALAEDYFRLYTALMRCRRPLIAGHIDLVRKHNAALHLFDEASPRYRNAALGALRAARETGAVLEVNTGGMARYDAKAPYPDRPLLEAWRAMGGEVILSSDCHHAPDILAGYAQATRLLREVGYESVRVLGTGEALLETTPLDLF